MRPAEIPAEADWGNYHTDLDARHAHDLLIGKSVAEAVVLVRENPIERSDELLFAPAMPFQYYVFAFVDYVMSAAAQGDADAASSLLSLLAARLKRDPGSVLAVLPDLQPCLGSLAGWQVWFDADPSIYGSFAERVDHLIQLARTTRNALGEGD